MHILFQTGDLFHETGDLNEAHITKHRGPIP